MERGKMDVWMLDGAAKVGAGADEWLLSFIFLIRLEPSGKQ